MYLDMQREVVEKRPEKGEKPPGPRAWQAINHCFERALLFLGKVCFYFIAITNRKMPRIWLDYADYLQKQGLVTKTRRTFDRALRSLPVTQHDRIWDAYLKFAETCGVVETAVRVYRRYLKVYLHLAFIRITQCVVGAGTRRRLCVVFGGDAAL
jgi:pre-mRNA-splicing factor SYF1